MTDKTSARIYQFPPGGRSDRGRRPDAAWPAARFPAKAAESAAGSGWYHEEAIREDERARAKVPSFPSRH
jgi:hypothetical protein